MGRLAALAAALFATVALAGHANAAEAPRDPIFEAAIQYGRVVCSLLKSEPTLTALVDADGKLTTAGFTESEAGAIVGDSIIAFCPEQQAAVTTAVQHN